jgi:hypothetical protein
MGSICTKPKTFFANAPSTKGDPSFLSNRSSQQLDEASEGIKANQNLNALNEIASVLVQEITVLDGRQAQEEDSLEEMAIALADAHSGGNAIAVSAFNKTIEDCKLVIATIIEKRLHLETELFEIRGNISDIEDSAYSSKLCAAIDESQILKFPLLGIKLSWFFTTLESRLQAMYPDKPLSAFTMSFLSSNYVMQETQQNGLSLCDHFISEGEGKTVGLATHYVVYSQTMQLSDFKNSLENYFSQNGINTPDAFDDIFIWVDVFSFTQDSSMFISLNMDSTWFQSCLAPALKRISKVILILDHKNFNAVLKSSWALMELLISSILPEVRAEIAMSKIDARLFIDEASMKGTRRVFPQVKAMNLSECSIPGKKDDILAALEGFASNESDCYEIIKCEIDALLSDFLYSLLDVCRKTADIPYASLVSTVIGDFCQTRCLFDESEQSFKYALKLSRKLFGNLDPRTIRIVKKMIKFYETTGAFDLAEDLRNFGKPNRENGSGELAILSGADIHVAGSKHN